jgi:purine-binding chemotaxis protein CheW
MDIAGIRKKLKKAKETAETVPCESPSTELPVVKPTMAKESEADLPEQDEAEAVKTIELLTFKLAEEDYAFRVPEVKEILKPYSVTRVPRVSPYVVGITSLRGKIIPVLDLRRKLLSRGMGEIGAKLKVLILNGPKGPIGVAVDRGIDVIRVPESSIMPPPAHLSERELDLIEGVVRRGDRFVSIIRTEGVLNFEGEEMFL